MRFEVPRHDVAVPSDAAAIARGRHLSGRWPFAPSAMATTSAAGSRSSIRCSAAATRRTLPAWPHAASAPSYQVADWERALRHGVDGSGRGLLFMPVDHYRHLSATPTSAR